MSKLERYLSYKDSGVEWLGEIPEEWESLANKHIFKIKQTLVGKRSKEYDLLSLTLKGIIKRDMDNPKGKFPTDFDTYQEVKKDDFIFCLFDVEETPRTVGLSKYNGMITGAYTVMETKGVSKDYLYYFYLNLDSSKRFKPLYKGLRNTIPKDSFFSFKTFIPPKQEQIKIASFLDTKTEQLDKAIKQKEQLIELLKERRQILINDAITKGIDKTVTMKDSGVEWIGKIPEHWETVKSKRLFRARKEKARKGDEQLTASQKHGVIYQKDYMELEGRKVTQVETNYEILKRVEPNDFLISMRSFQGGIEYCRYAGSVSSAYVALIPIKHVVSEYFKYLFKSYVYIQALASTSNLVRDGQALRFDNFSLVDLIIIPEKEQESIAKYLDEQIPKIDKAINLQQQQITKLKEYKTTLIDSVVTGKVRVCDE